MLYPELEHVQSEDLRASLLKEAARPPRGFYVLMCDCAVILWGGAYMVAARSSIAITPFVAGLTGGLAGAAMFLAAPGIYGILAQNRIRKRLREMLSVQGLPICIHCGYDLRSIETATCPECGNPYRNK